MFIGIICIVLASIAFGIGPVFAKELIISGLSTMDILLYPKIIILFVIGIIFLIRRVSIRVTKTQLWQLSLIYGGSSGMTALLLVSSYHFMPIGLATMFHFIYPVIVTICMAVLYKEKITTFKIIAIVLAMAGLGLIFDLTGSMSLPGIALAIGSGFTYAIYVIANRKSSFGDFPALVIVFYSSLVNLIGVALFQLVSGRLVIPLTVREWVLISANGLVSGLFAFFVLIIGIRRVGASNAAIANMIEPITALAAGAIVFGDRIEFKALCGCILVLLSITFIAMNRDNAHAGEKTVSKTSSERIR